MLEHPGTSERVISETTAGSGVTSKIISIQSDQALVSYWVSSIVGSLTIRVYSQIDDGKEELVHTFGPISAASTALVSDTTGTVNSRLRIEATYTGICTYEVHVRAIEGSSSGGGAATHVIIDNEPLEVTLVDPTDGNVQSAFDEALAVASAATVTILTYTVPPATVAYLLRAEMSGTSIATYDILINSAPFARKRTYWSGDFCAEVGMGDSLSNAYKLSAGDVVEIQVTNFRPTSNDFEARLQYIEVA